MFLGGEEAIVFLQFPIAVLLCALPTATLALRVIVIKKKEKVLR
jgi:hypothetical protein